MHVLLVFDTVWDRNFTIMCCHAFVEYMKRVSYWPSEQTGRTSILLEVDSIVLWQYKVLILPSCVACPKILKWRQPRCVALRFRYRVDPGRTVCTLILLEFDTCYWCSMEHDVVIYYPHHMLCQYTTMVMMALRWSSVVECIKWVSC